MNNTLYVAESDGRKVRKITPTGLVSTFAGNGTAGLVNGLGTLARFYDLKGITVDANYSVYVTEDGGVDQNRIRQLSPVGQVSVWAEGGKQEFTTAGTFSFTVPAGVSSISAVSGLGKNGLGTKSAKFEKYV